MKIIFNLFIIVSYLMMTPACAQVNENVRVKSDGETVISTSDVQLIIKTLEVDIGEPSDGQPKERQSSCTYSRYPCSVVEGIDISVNGHPLIIPVPRSVYCDRADVNKAGIKADGRVWVLTLYGGDPAESYIAKIIFDETRVLRREILDPLSLGDLLQETIYHVVTVGD